MHWCKWDPDQREVRVGFLEERDLVGGHRKGQGEQGRRYAGAEIQHRHGQEANVSDGQVRVDETRVHKPESKMEFHLITFLPTGK